MKKNPLEMYLQNMTEIKKRHEVILAILNHRATTSVKITDIETIALQIRKILELVALGSLVLNKEKYSEMHKNFSSQWNAKYILNDIERINPSFYPKPIDEVPIKYQSRIINNLQEKKDGFLTKDEFIELYDRLGGLLHTNNPFVEKDNVSEFEKNIIDILNKIKNLLNSHIIKIYDDEFYLIHMQENGTEFARGYVFSQVK